MHIIVTKRAHDYHACIRGRPEIWGCGKSENDAVGDLIRSHAEQFNIVVAYP